MTMVALSAPSNVNCFVYLTRGHILSLPFIVSLSPCMHVPIHHVLPRAYHVVPRAYHVLPRAYHVAPGAYHAVPRAFTTTKALPSSASW